MSTALLVDFYKETSSTFSEEHAGTFESVVRLNPQHDIYKGHFKQVPITPGVCMTQMIKEILSKKLKKNLFMSSGDNIKFLTMINPNDIPELTIKFAIKITDDTLDVSATYSNNDTACMKFKGKFKITE